MPEADTTGRGRIVESGRRAATSKTLQLELRRGSNTRSGSTGVNGGPLQSAVFLEKDGPRRLG